MHLLHSLGTSSLVFYYFFSCINGEDPLSGLTPLLLAVKSTKGNDKLNIIKKLLQLGASPTHVDFSGNSVLHFAAETTKEIIKVNLERSLTFIKLRSL